MEKKTVLITGTSSGIGLATANYFADKGWNVAATVRKAADFFLDKGQSHARQFIADISHEADCKKLVEQTLNEFGGLDVLVNNAGLAVMSPFEEADSKIVEQQFAVNLFGAMHLTKYVLPHFRRQRSGLIATVSTIGGRIGVPFYSIHSACKFAAEGFFESLRFELYPFNIRVKIIEPGSYRSRLLANGNAFRPKQRIADYLPFTDKHEKQLRLYEQHRRDPVEVAEAIWNAVHDSSNQLRYIVGPDAHHMDEMRKSLTDEELFSLMGNIFQLIH